ncbi:MAG TPA: hypothetical protein PLW32_00250 [Chitinophagaceae bacterium]|jgi:ABC-type methionine transport system ATPase subunit|nr:hypothetical protein [Chitinophagaceae bacterium]HPH22281.1 hypothetical protein [Chitinophagaceae bacterium]
MEKLSLTTLFYLVTQQELNQIVEFNYKKIPPRANPQNMFYALLNGSYAEQLAYDWNIETETQSNTVHVVSVDLPTDYLEQFLVQSIATDFESELWILTTELENFNQQIIGRVKLVKSFLGNRLIKIAV